MKFLHKDSFILFAGEEGAILSHFVNHKLTQRIFCSSSDHDPNATFGGLLQKHANTPIYILLDNLDQTYQPSTFPPVAKMSVQKLVKTRLDRDFPPEDLKGSLLIGREKEGRNDWKFLLISVSNSPQMMQWLDFVLEQDNPFKGLYLVPVESESILKEFNKIHKEHKESEAGWKMLTLYNKVGGFRQIITHNGRLAFTRLTQSVGDNSPMVVAGNIEQESNNTLAYLKRLSFRPSDGLINYIVASDEILNAIEDTKIEGDKLYKLNPAQLVESFGLDPEPYQKDHFSDVAFSAIFQKYRRHILPIHTPISEKINHFYYAIIGVRALTFIVPILILIFVVSSFLRWYDETDGRSKAQNRLNVSLAQLNQVIEDTKFVPEDIDRITDVVSIYETFSAQQFTPFVFIEQLTNELRNNMHVTSLTWGSEQTFEKRAQNQEAPTSIVVKCQFNFDGYRREDVTQELKRYLKLLKAKFPEYKVEYSYVPDEYREKEGFTADLNTVPDSKRIVQQPVPVELSFQTLSAEEKRL